MIRVITYGTYDLLHQGHINLLKRAKQLGDYLIVGVTADDFDKVRGKINVQQTLMERVEAIRSTGLVDEIIVEEYEGQKIDDIRRYNIDIFTVGSDWVGTFDYLNEYCKVIYLDRTRGISSSELRAGKRKLKVAVAGGINTRDKFIHEARYVNGVEVTAVYLDSESEMKTDHFTDNCFVSRDYSAVLEQVDAVYLLTNPVNHYQQIRAALCKKKHVLCASPIAMTAQECQELFELACEQGCILMEGIKTAYATAFSRMELLVKGGKIGDIVSIDATCTSLFDKLSDDDPETTTKWNSICEWGPVALLPIFQLLGTNYSHKSIVSHYLDSAKTVDGFTTVRFIYPSAVATIKVAKAAKSEGELIITGTKGYVYVPAPWWKTDYFEVRFENMENNKRYFYQLDGEGIRYELVSFVRSIEMGKEMGNIDRKVSIASCQIIEEVCKHGSAVIEI